MGKGSGGGRGEDGGLSLHFQDLDDATISDRVTKLAIVPVYRKVGRSEQPLSG